MPESTPRRATRSQRMAALLIDLAIPFAILAAFYGFAVVDSRGSNGSHSSVAIVMPAFVALAALLVVVVINAILLFKSNQTIGKKAMHLKIVRARYLTPVSSVRIFLLHALLAALLVTPYIGPPLLIISGLFLFTADQRCLHDKIADTDVIQIKARV